MIRQLLLCAGVTVSLVAAAETYQSASKAQLVNDVKVVGNARGLRVRSSKMNDGSNSSKAQKAVSADNVHWKRPAGQFWGTGYSTTNKQMGYYFTPLVLRPWVQYDIVNESTAVGAPLWTINNYNAETGQFVNATSNEVDATVSYIQYETAEAPLLSYKTLAYPLQYAQQKLTGQAIRVAPVENIIDVFGDVMPVSSHYYSNFTRNSDARYGLGIITGADTYDGMETGYWFGTNSQGINAMATRFEKPEHPYLLNSVYYYYQFFQDVPQNIPMKAYVFKTVNDAKEETDSNGNVSEMLELGDLIAVSESFIPAAVYSDDNFQNAVEFKFVEKNPVTGAESNISLEIEDDITVIVTGFDADLGNGGALTTGMSEDTFDEGYGNLGFIGRLEESEDGQIQYRLWALKNFFVDPMPNTTLGVLADVSYPWLHSYLMDQPNEVKLANDGVTTEEKQGLDYTLMLLSTSETGDFEITYDGEDECEWLSVVDVYDDYQVSSETGEEEFTGITGLVFEATPNSDDESRVCHVTISIPAAKYEITFLQGSKADTAVDVVTATGKTQYFDLAGRKVANPEKGVYIKVNGNKAEKVVL